MALIATQAALATGAAHAGGPVQPQPPDYLIEIVRGQTIYVELPAVDESTVDEVRIDVAGQPVKTLDFPPFDAAVIPTKNFERRGIAVGVIHPFTISTVQFPGAPVEVAEYSLLIRPLPVIRRVHVRPLVIENRTSLVGFQLRGISRGTQVRAWGRGFRNTSSRRPLPLFLMKIGPSSRTYVVPGRLDWAPRSRPHVTFSLVPRFGTLRNGFSVLGRIFTGVLKTNRTGDTSIRQTNPWRYCSSELTRDERNRPPRRRSCIYSGY